MPTRPISVLLSDDNLIVRDGVRSLLAGEPDLEVVGVAADYDGLLTEAERTRPQVVVTDIRMPPSFQREGIDAAKEIRRRDRGTGVVILSQYREPEYAIALLSEGSDGYAHLLKDHVAEGRYLAQAVREVATGGSMIDPAIAQAILSPVTQASALTPADVELLRMLAEGRPLAVMASARKLTPAAWPSGSCRRAGGSVRPRSCSRRSSSPTCAAIDDRGAQRPGRACSAAERPPGRDDGGDPPGVRHRDGLHG